MEIFFISNNVGYNYKLYIKYNNVGQIVWNSFNRGREKEEVDSGIMEANNTTMWQYRKAHVLKETGDLLILCKGYFLIQRKSDKCVTR